MVQIQHNNRKDEELNVEERPWADTRRSRTELTTFSLLQPCLVFREARVVSSTRTMTKLELALPPPTLLIEPFTLLALGSVVIT